MRTAATVALRAVPRAALSLPPAWRRRLGVLLAGLIVLACGYWLWFRDSSFAQVEQVRVSGLSGPQARGIRTSLVGAARDMTTLHVSEADLRAAVVDYPVVRTVTAQGDFPHTLHIEVTLNLPVAILQTRSTRTPVAADGLLLPDVPITGGLPVLRTQAALPTERVTSGRPFELVRIVAAAPDPLRGRIEDVWVKEGSGLFVELRDGPDLVFGSAERIPAKWMAAARVLATPAARGATYIDLRLPERPAAGGLSTTTVVPLAPAGEATAPPATETAPSTVTPAEGAETAPPTTTTEAAPATTAPTTTEPTTTTTAPTTTAPQAVPPATSGGAAEAP